MYQMHPLAPDSLLITSYEHFVQLSTTTSTGFGYCVTSGSRWRKREMTDAISKTLLKHLLPYSAGDAGQDDLECHDQLAIRDGARLIGGRS